MKFLAAIGSLAIVIAIVAAVYFFGGFYSVAGTQEDPAIVHWALVKVRTMRMISHPPDSTIPPKCRPAHVNFPNSAVSVATAPPA
jgi:hypothetical protein